MQMPWKKALTRNEIAEDHVYDFIENKDPSSDEYTKAVNNLRVLKDMGPDKGPKLNINTVLTIAAYVMVVGVAICVEIFGHSLTTKALRVADLLKPRI